MKYLLLLLTSGVVYLTFFRASPTPQVVQAISEPVVMTNGAAEPRSNSLKRPLDRTHAVLDQVSANVSAGSSE